MPLIRYNTTNSPVVFVGESPAQDLNVSSETAKEMTKMARLLTRNSQTDSVVPSSYNWNPTNPFTSRHVHSELASPFCTATNHGNAPPFRASITPASRTKL